MKTIVAVIDGGGRGSALIDTYAKSPKVDELIAIPGNDLMQINTTKKVHIFPHLKTTSKDKILKICRKFNVTLIDVAQDNAVEAGLADLLRENNFKVIGPSRLAGQIEWDKAYSRKVLEEINIPQPFYKVFEDEETGIAFLNTQLEDRQWFIKAYGLTDGKGALPANNRKEAIERIRELARFSESGSKYLIEDWLVGEEFSAFMISDGKTHKLLGFAQDHKRANDGDQGENTGGMGCSTPPLVVASEIQKQAEKIMINALEYLSSAGRPYIGVIYLGGIIVGGKVYVIEFNARWGDPEAECILPGFQTDWFEVSMACVNGNLGSIPISHDGKTRIAVAVASNGYPADYSGVNGKEILGLDQIGKNPDVKIYGAGTKVIKGKIFINGGRLFYIVADGGNIIETREKAYKVLEKIKEANSSDLVHYRSDIGYRDVSRV
jgi:phosphoribosylamine--glycine ligase